MEEIPAALRGRPAADGAEEADTNAVGAHGRAPRVRTGGRLPAQYFRSTARTTPRTLTSLAFAMMGFIRSLAGCNRTLLPFSR